MPAKRSINKIQKKLPNTPQTTIKPLVIKLKSEIATQSTTPDVVQNTDAVAHQAEVLPNTDAVAHQAAVSPKTNTKRTQKAKSKPSAQSGARLVLPDSLDDIISDMQFQDPRPTITESTVLEKQARVIQKQQELLEQLQQGIRPGWFIQCLAKRADGKQCTRNIKKGTEYCMGHAIKCIYGRITDGIASQGQVYSNLPVPTALDSVAANTNTTNTKRCGKQPSSTAEVSVIDATGLEAGPVTRQLTCAKKLAIQAQTNINATITNLNGMESGSDSESDDGMGCNNELFGHAAVIVMANDQPRVLTRSITKSAVKISGPKPKQTVKEPGKSTDPLVAPKKRGRRRKLPIDPKFGNNDYIIMWPIICEDQRYLTDRYENIYTNDPGHPVFVGVREVSGHINRTALPKTN